MGAVLFNSGGRSPTYGMSPNGMVPGLDPGTTGVRFSPSRPTRKKKNMNDSTHDQMKRENSQLRKSLIETNKQFVEVVNENLALRREIEKLKGK